MNNVVICLLTVILLQACSSSGLAPVTNRSEVKKSAVTTTQRAAKAKVKSAEKNIVQSKADYHIVNQGDTLYSIAWRYNLDYKQVANWNQIRAPYIIYQGQVVRLKAILKKKSELLKKPVEKPKLVLKKKTKPVSRASKPKSALPKNSVKWTWPVSGKIVKSNSPISKKGLDILGSAGQRIKAAAAGDVVYSGSGLLGYGKLIIIKHNETYLSAYAYNSKLLIKEGSRVKAGDVISEMGQDNTGRTVLHFEIRQNGKPINPVKYLPKQRI